MLWLGYAPYLPRQAINRLLLGLLAARGLCHASGKPATVDEKRDARTERPNEAVALGTATATQAEQGVVDENRDERK